MISDIEIKNILSKNGIKPTLIRLKVLQYLLSSKNHPDADTIYKELSKIIPTLSLTSIYNTLNLLSKHKVINEFNFNEEFSRYDADLSNHGHFKCIKCNRIYDFNIDEKIKIKDFSLGEIIEQKVYLLGICNECKKNIV